MKLDDITKTLDSAFSYTCNACNKCCYGKEIQVNPYETLRLSKDLEISTTEFRNNHLNGQMLKHKSDSDACIFLGDSGCKVHKHRPLVCRLYPLSRLLMNDGQELFFKVKTHTLSAGEFGMASTVSAYLKSQEVEAYLVAEKAYLKLIRHMATVALDKPNSNQQSEKENPSEFNYIDWVLDPDPLIIHYCNWKNIQIPSETEQKLKLHIEALYSWANGEWDADFLKNET